jgi:ankyrin repeat protein
MNRIMKLIVIILAALLIWLSAGCGGGIYRVVDNGDQETVTMMLEKDPNALYARDKNGYSLLHRAALAGRKQIAELLIARGAAVDDRALDGNGVTSLHLAADRGHKDIVRLLIEKGADVNAIARGDYFRWTPLGFASMKGHKDMVELLIQMGANVKSGGKSKFNPLLFAVSSGHKDIAEILLDNGAELGVTDGKTQRAWGLLHEAVYKRHKDVAELLIKKGMDINQRDFQGKTPLHAIFYWKKERVDIVRLLLDNGADVNAAARGGSTPLHVAASCGLIGCAELLLERGAAVDLTDELGRTPLYMAERSGGESMLGLLLSMHTASRKGDLAAVSSLLDKYPQLIHLRDEEGKTPLYHAVENNHVRIAALLIAGGANVNVKSKFRRIELLYGVVAKLLVPRVGRIKMVTDQNTPLTIAVKKGYKEMARLLEEHGALPD